MALCLNHPLCQLFHFEHSRTFLFGLNECLSIRYTVVITSISTSLVVYLVMYHHRSCAVNEFVHGIYRCINVTLQIYHSHIDSVLSIDDAQHAPYRTVGRSARSLLKRNRVLMYTYILQNNVLIKCIFHDINACNCVISWMHREEIAAIIKPFLACTLCSLLQFFSVN